MTVFKLKVRKLFTIILLMLVHVSAKAQIPYFAACLPKGGFSAYTSVTNYTTDKSWESFTLLMYGCTDYLGVGMHVDAFDTATNVGPDLWAGHTFSQWFSFSGHVVPNFDVSKNFKFSDVTCGLYMNGNILKGGKLFWLTNTYSIIGTDETIWAQYWYLGSGIRLKENHTLIPMIGCMHSWKFEEPADMMVTLMYKYKNFWVQAGCGNFISGEPVYTVALQYDI